MEPSVEMVEGAERQSLGAARARREDDAALLVIVEAGEEPGDVLGGVLPVSIHDDDGGAFELGVDERQPDRDGALVSEVASQDQHVQALDGGEGVRELVGPARLCRAVVDQEDVDDLTTVGQDSIEPGEQQRDRFPVVVDRYQEDEVRSGFPRSVGAVHDDPDREVGTASASTTDNPKRTEPRLARMNAAGANRRLTAEP